MPSSEDTKGTGCVVVYTRREPLDMGDVFVVDNGDLGITVKSKGRFSMPDVLKRWVGRESKKVFSYEDCETITFFNGYGAVALRRWLCSVPNREIADYEPGDRVYLKKKYTCPAGHVYVPMTLMQIVSVQDNTLELRQIFKRGMCVSTLSGVVIGDVKPV